MVVVHDWGTQHTQQQRPSQDNEIGLLDLKFKIFKVSGFCIL